MQIAEMPLAVIHFKGEVLGGVTNDLDLVFGNQNLEEVGFFSVGVIAVVP